MKPPYRKDDAFLAEVQAAVAAASSTPDLQLWWLGQSGFLALARGTTVLFDPYLSDSLTRKYAQTDKPHVRISERVVAPERLDFVDLVTSSHNHTDHLDPETLQPLASANPNLFLVCPEANRSTVRERSRLPDSRILGLDAPAEGPGAALGVPTPGGPIRVHPIPAAHEALDRDAQGRLICLGFVVEIGPFRLYHSGDTVRYEGMAERLRPYEVDVALLPINGRAPERRVAGNLWGREAAQLAKDIGARLVIPCHYDLFAFNTATPDEFQAECDRLDQPYRTLQLGERCTVSAIARR